MLRACAARCLFRTALALLGRPHWFKHKRPAARQSIYNVPRWSVTMRRVVILIWAASLAAQQEVSKPRATPDDIKAGAKTFRFHCAPCHGLRGEGGRGPNLVTGRFYRGATDADLLKNISEGIPGTEMPALFYMEDRVRQVIAYIRSLPQAE